VTTTPDIVEWARDHLGIDLLPWQAEVLRRWQYRPGAPTTMSRAKRGGKSMTILVWDAYQRTLLPESPQTETGEGESIHHDRVHNQHL